MEFVRQLMVKERVELGCGVQDQPWWGGLLSHSWSGGYFYAPSCLVDLPPSCPHPSVRQGGSVGGVFESPPPLGGDGLFG